MGNGQHAGAAREASPYVELDRADWAGLAQTSNDATEQPLTAEEIDRVRGLGDQLNLHEVQQVYLPLSRLLSLYVGSSGAGCCTARASRSPTTARRCSGS